MGNVTAKTSGEIASFMTPAKTNIKSLKVHFSPKQLGTGDPGPENVREIVGWDGVEVNGSEKNIAHIVGYSAQNSDSNNSRIISNSYGTTINTTEFSLPDTKLIITQTQSPNTTVLQGYQNGYIAILVDNLIWGQKYNICFKVEDITSNPLNASLSNLKLLVPNGSSYSSSEVQNNRILFKNILWQPYPNTNVNRRNFEIRICGMSFTLSEFMVTPVDEDNFEFEPYQGNNISYQWKLSDEYQEVEYIESTGTQYIDTGITESCNYKIRLDITQPSKTRGIYGWWDSTSQNNMQYYARTEGIIVTRGTNNRYASVINLHDITISANDGAISIDNNEVLQGEIPPNVGIPFLLFAYKSSAINKGICRIYYAKLYSLDNNQLRNFIPCYRKSDNEIGMYDTVSQTFYTNQGTGTFIKGNDVDKTFYGGYVDLISGELVETHYKDNLTQTVENLNANYNTESTVFFRCQMTYNGIPQSYKFEDLMCTNLNVVNRDIWGIPLEHVNEITGRYASTNKVCMNMYNSVFGIESTDTLTEKNNKINAYLVENPIQISYKLATPITHQLTPTQLESFIGQNNFWSNADYVEIEYDLIETEDIQKCRKKIILNQPHIESATGDIASFTTNMKAPLKECKVYFNPIQEGSGDPSPDNVRNIIGWNGVNVVECEKNLVPFLRNSLTATSYYNGFSGWSETWEIPERTSYTYSVYLDNSNCNNYSNIQVWLRNADNSAYTHVVGGSHVEAGKKGLSVITLDFANLPNDYYACWGLSIRTGCIATKPVVYKTNQRTTTSVNWSDEVGTVYGGYIDLVKGELVATHVIFEKKWSEYPNNYAMTDVNRRSILFPYERRKIGATRALCNIAPPAHDLQNKIHFYIAPENNYIYMFLPKDLDEETLIQIASKIEEPIHYSLTPQQLLTFKGENNIWSDTNGQTEVKFWTH